MTAFMVVKGADLCPLFIAEQRDVDGPWPVALVKLSRTAYINQTPGSGAKGVDLGCQRSAHA